MGASAGREPLCATFDDRACELPPSWCRMEWGRRPAAEDLRGLPHRSSAFPPFGVVPSAPAIAGPVASRPSRAIGPRGPVSLPRAAGLVRTAKPLPDLEPAA